jgi:hypothetical protein
MCRTIGVLVGFTSQATIARERGALPAAITANMRLPFPSRCQYRFAIQAVGFFQWRCFAHRQSDCQRTISAFWNADLQRYDGDSSPIPG